jgi:hypothetical protein
VAADIRYGNGLFLEVLDDLQLEIIAPVIAADPNRVAIHHFRPHMDSIINSRFGQSTGEFYTASEHSVNNNRFDKLLIDRN